MLKRILLLGVLGLFLVLSLSIGYSVYFAAHSRTLISSPPPVVWKLQQEQPFVKNSSSIFSIKWITITPQEFHFFYVFQSPHQEIKVKVSSSLTYSSKTETNLKTTMEVLKHIQTYTVGVIHAERISHIGQVITLQITRSGGRTTSWSLALLKQVENEPHKDTTWYGIYPGFSGLPEVKWYGPVKEQQVAYFKVAGSVRGNQQPTYVFVRSDDPLVVRIITMEEYLKIAGPENLDH